MTALSVNLNKIALLRNSREGNYPNVVEHAQLCIDQGADGITVHPRPDQRHIRPSDVRQLAALVSPIPVVEFKSQLSNLILRAIPLLLPWQTIPVL